MFKKLYGLILLALAGQALYAMNQTNTNNNYLRRLFEQYDPSEMNNPEEAELEDPIDQTQNDNLYKSLNDQYNTIQTESDFTDDNNNNNDDETIIVDEEFTIPDTALQENSTPSTLSVNSQKFVTNPSTIAYFQQHYSNVPACPWDKRIKNLPGSLDQYNNCVTQGLEHLGNEYYDIYSLTADKVRLQTIKDNIKYTEKNSTAAEKLQTKKTHLEASIKANKQYNNKFLSLAGSTNSFDRILQQVVKDGYSPSLDQFKRIEAVIFKVIKAKVGEALDNKALKQQREEEIKNIALLLEIILQESLNKAFAVFNNDIDE